MRVGTERSTMSSEQSNPFMDASNTFSVNITTNVWLTAGTTLTLVGLQVLKQLEAHSPMFILDAFFFAPWFRCKITLCASLCYNTVIVAKSCSKMHILIMYSVFWTQETCSIKSGVQEIQSLEQSPMQGLWINTIAQQKAVRITTILSSSSYTISFAIELRNCNFARAYTPIVVGGTVHTPTLTCGRCFHSLLDRREFVELGVLRQPRLGIEHGSLPLFVIEPEMLTKVIAQSNYLAGVENIITVTIATKVNIAAASRLTITGFIGLLNPPSTFDVTCIPPAINTSGDFSNSALVMYITSGLT